MEELNVCLINDSFPPAIDGVANAVTNYAQIIARDYGSPTVVTPYYPDADDSVYPFPVVRYPSVDMTKLVGYRAGMPFSPEIATKLEKAHFDIIHSHCPITSTMLARSVRARLDVPLVFTYHTKFDIDIANAIRSKRLQEEAAKILVENISACDEVWTVSNGAGENLRKLGYKGDYIVMPNGVDFPQGRVSEALIDEVTKGYDLPRDVPLFLFVGRMMWYKGIRITLDALKKLSDAGFDFRMVFIGGGTDKKEIVAYSEKLGLAGKVFFTDPIHDRTHIRAWYCRANLFLFPSTFDSAGSSGLRARQCSGFWQLRCRRYDRWGEQHPDRGECRLHGGQPGEGLPKPRKNEGNRQWRAAGCLHLLGHRSQGRGRALRGGDRELQSGALSEA